MAMPRAKSRQNLLSKGVFGSQPTMTIPKNWRARMIWLSFGLGPKFWLAHHALDLPMLFSPILWLVVGAENVRQ